MNSLGRVWGTLSPQRRIFVIAATIAVFIAVLLLARGASSRDMSLLFGGLDPQAAGEVVTALDQRGVAYEVRGNAIYVPTADRDGLRMALAGDGLPATGNQGYELLDQLSGFSTTAQMFDAAYWRAKEGELARTILASPHIRGARVHISTQVGRPFRATEPPSAAVTVTTANGSLSAPHVKALQFLVSAAVPGLLPEAVAVIDDAGGLLSEADGAAIAGNADDRAEALRRKVERLLSARVGPGNAVVEVAIDTVTETEQITERLVDPDSRIAISTEVTESNGTSRDSREGAVTVASNLPDGDAAAQGGEQSNENSESRTLTNYEVSETERQILRAPGAVRRLTVAVLVNEPVITAPDGTTTVNARTPDELLALEALVASAVGLDEARGDVLTLRSLPFQPFVTGGTEAGVMGAAAGFDLMRLIQTAVLAIVALILGLFVVRPILAPQRLNPEPLAIAGGDDGDAGADDIMTFDGEGFGGMMTPQIGDFSMDADEDPVTRLRRKIAERQPETLRILQDWIEEPAAKAQR